MDDRQLAAIKRQEARLAAMRRHPGARGGHWDAGIAAQDARVNALAAEAIGLD